MKLKKQRSNISVILYVFASIIAILGTILLISNLILFNNNVAQYVAQGNAVNAVLAQLVPTQLIPGIFEPISIYGGIALLLIITGIINQKVSKYLEISTKNDGHDTTSK